MNGRRKDMPDIRRTREEQTAAAGERMLPFASGAVDELIEELQSLTEGAEWVIPLEQVLAILHISREEYFRFTYQARGGPFSESIMPAEDFGPGNIHELVLLLKYCGHADAEERFFHAGYYFGEGRLLDWLELFVSVTVSRMQSHEVDKELLDTSIAGTRRFLDGVRFYCDARFDQEELIDFAAGLYLKKFQVDDHHVSRRLTAEYIRRQFKQRILKWEDLHLAVEGELRVKAVLWGLAEPEPAPPARLSPEQKRALEELGLPRDRAPSLGDLKSRYRQLMKTHHPDVNPEGLEPTRRINEAYALLLRETHQAASA